MFDGGLLACAINILCGGGFSSHWITPAWEKPVISERGVSFQRLATPTSGEKSPKATFISPQLQRQLFILHILCITLFIFFQLYLPNLCLSGLHLFFSLKPLTIKLSLISLDYSGEVRLYKTIWYVPLFPA